MKKLIFSIMITALMVGFMVLISAGCSNQQPPQKAPPVVNEDQASDQRSGDSDIFELSETGTSDENGEDKTAEEETDDPDEMDSDTSKADETDKDLERAEKRSSLKKSSETRVKASKEKLQTCYRKFI